MVKQYKDTKTPLENRQNWRTPPFVFNYYNKIHNFTLDAAADHDNHLCDSYWTEEDDCLVQDWHKKTFLNPPYSNISPFVYKAIEEAKKGNTTVMLIPSDTGVKYFSDLYDNCERIDFIVGRLAFISSLTGKPVAGNNKASMIVTFSREGLHRETKTDYILRDAMK